MTEFPGNCNKRAVKSRSRGCRKRDASKPGRATRGVLLVLVERGVDKDRAWAKEPKLAKAKTDHSMIIVLSKRTMVQHNDMLRQSIPLPAAGRKRMNELLT